MSRDRRRRSLIGLVARRYVASTGTLLIGIVSQVGLFALIARWLGVEQFGQFVIISTATILATPLCGIGGGDAMARRLSRNHSDYGRMLGHGLILIAASGVFFTFGLGLFLSLIVHISPSPLVNFAFMTSFTVAGVVLVGEQSMENSLLATVVVPGIDSLRVG